MRNNRFDLCRDDTKMLQGIAIISMLVLHLFCRKGDDVFGQPLIWLDSETPIVYVFGFLAEICVPLFAFCSGYGHFVDSFKYDNCIEYYKHSFKRIMALLKRYWVICILFSVVGCVCGDPSIPGEFSVFLKNMLVFFSSYNGAWWYVSTYIIVVAFSYPMLRFAKKLSRKKRVVFFGFAFAALSALEFFRRVVLHSGVFSLYDSNLLFVQTSNYIRVVIPYLFGVLFASYGVIGAFKTALDSFTKPKLKNKLLIVVLILGSGIYYVLQMPAVSMFYTLFVVVCFALIEKGNTTKKVLLYFSKHSTNIWLSHMFFYLVLFNGLAQKGKYPIIMFLILSCASILTSYFVETVLRGIDLALNKIKRTKVRLD